MIDPRHIIVASVVAISVGAVFLPARTFAQKLGVVRQTMTVHPNCNEGQRSRMERAITVALTAVSASFREIRPNSPIYRTWFGEWSDANAEVVQYYLQHTERAWPGLELRCGGGSCEANKTAFFQPRPLIANRFTVCDEWHSLPPLSVEASSSRAGVIVHEVTHGVGSPGTLDVRDLSSCSTGPNARCYGADNARRLAQDPTCTVSNNTPWIFDTTWGAVFRRTEATCKALFNAENYEHFVSDVLVNTILLVTD